MIWLNGVLLDEAEPHLHASDRGFAHGDGVFETLRATRGVGWHVERHLARLRRGAGVLGIPVGYDDTEIVRGIDAVCSQVPVAAVRISLSRGPGPRGLMPQDVPCPTLVIAAGPLAAGTESRVAIIATSTRRNEFSPLAAIKSLNYLDSVLARREANLAGADEAILRNTAGDLAEACAGNLFLCFGQVWLTPSVADGALPGIARGLLLEAGLACERTINPVDLESASAAFVSNSLFLQPICKIDRCALQIADMQEFRRALQDERATAG